MKKKISYDGIPKKVLNTILGECYGLEEYTLKYELDKYGEDIIAHRYNLTKDGNIEWFHAWS